MRGPESGSRSLESSYGRIHEIPQQQFRDDLRAEINMISPKSVLGFEVTMKILELLDIKDKIEEIQQYRDDPTVYQNWKQLGLFIVIDRTSRIGWKDDKSGFEIKQGDKILDIHLPPVPQEQKTFDNITRSMQLIADYIVKQRLNPKYIMGVTFEKLARVSQRQGFTVVEPQVPDDIRRGIERVYHGFEPSGLNENSMGKVLLCYQPTKKFLQRYLSK